MSFMYLISCQKFNSFYFIIDDSNYSRQILVVSYLECPEPQVHFSSALDCTSGRADGSECEIECSKGYEIIGTATTSCQRGIWYGPKYCTGIRYSERFDTVF